MIQLFLISTVICFLSSLFWLAANITGNFNFFVKAMIRLIGVIGTTVPIIIWFKLAGII